MSWWNATRVDPHDIGHGVRIWPMWGDVAYYPESWPETTHDSDGERLTLVGITVADDRSEGFVRLSRVLTGNEDEEVRSAWQVHQLDPLTITPSVLDTRTGLHGFITNGQWVPA